SVGITHETSAAKTPQQNGVVERRNRTLVEAAKTMLIFSHALLFLWAKAISIACYTQNRSIIHRRFNKTPYELIQGRKSDISYLHVFGALCYPKNDLKDIGKLGAKGDIGFFIGYSANSVAYRFKTRTSKYDFWKISSELKLTYAPSTITPQRPSEHDLDILFEPLHNEYLGGRPSETPRAIPAAPVVHNLQAPTASMSFQDSALVPTSSSNTTVSSHNVDAPSPQHAQQQRNHTPSLTASAADNVPNAEDVYVCQPEGFIDADCPSHVYKLKKALYRRFDDDILVVQVYVDDIIFGSTNPRYATLFSDLMKSRFELSMMGEMTFFLGLQVNQSPSCIFINQSKYVREILKKYSLNTYDIVDRTLYMLLVYVLDIMLTPLRSTSKRLKGAFVISEEPLIWVSDTFKSTSGEA
nr:retrovirus-related Pol polyprotein from transposon TNT 1-94 [Tanacetum cinerariifolium]